jgi:uncharacterized membrane protein
MSEPSDSESVADSDFASGSIAGSHMDTDPEGPMFPLVSTYVAFSIDPVTTLAALDDPEVTAAASSLNPKTYVGYVRNVRIESFESTSSKLIFHDYGHRQRVPTMSRQNSWRIK